METRCQLQDVAQIGEGKLPTANRSLRWRVKLFLKRRLGDHTKRQLKGRLSRLLDRHQQTLPSSLQCRYEVGDWVRVRPYEQIVKTLDCYGQLKGCTFMDEMRSFCSTEQRVFRRVERFLDERDYRMRTTSGLVLLEGVLCEGIADYGRCDRSCFFFWREEWLAKVNGSDHDSSRPSSYVNESK